MVRRRAARCCGRTQLCSRSRPPPGAPIWMSPAANLTLVRRPTPGWSRSCGQRGHGRPCTGTLFATGEWPVAIEYWLLYLYNDFSDKHEADWEGITVVLDGETPFGVSYSAHQGRRWSAWSEQSASATHPVVYVARGSHANYPHSGGYGVRVCWTLYGRHCTPTQRSTRRQALVARSARRHTTCKSSAALPTAETGGPELRSRHWPDPGSDHRPAPPLGLLQPFRGPRRLASQWQRPAPDRAGGKRLPACRKVPTEATNSEDRADGSSVLRATSKRARTQSSGCLVLVTAQEVIERPNLRLRREPRLDSARRVVFGQGSRARSQGTQVAPGGRPEGRSEKRSASGHFSKVCRAGIGPPRAR